MRNGRGLPAALTIVSILGLTGVGVGYAAGSGDAVTSKTRDALERSSDQATLSTTGGDPVQVVSLSLPKGTWVVSSEATLVNFGPSDYTRCAIKANGVEIAAGATMVGDPRVDGNQGPASYVAGRGLVGMFANDAATDAAVTLECSHDNSTPDGQPPGYVDPDATLWAHKSTGGDAGPVGPQGPTGPEGPTGPQGAAGQSAPVVANSEKSLRVTIRHLPAVISRGVLLAKGLSFTVRADKPAALRANLSIAAQVASSGRSSRARRLLQFGIGSRRITLKPSGAIKGSTLRVLVTAVDAQGNHRTVRRAVRVK